MRPHKEMSHRFELYRQYISANRRPKGSLSTTCAGMCVYLCSCICRRQKLSKERQKKRETAEKPGEIWILRLQPEPAEPPWLKTLNLHVTRRSKAAQFLRAFIKGNARHVACTQRSSDKSEHRARRRVSFDAQTALLSAFKNSAVQTVEIRFLCTSRPAGAKTCFAEPELCVQIGGARARG